MHTFSANKSPAVLEVFEEDGAGVVMHIDKGDGDDGAVESEANVPRKHNHDYYQYLNVIKLMMQISQAILWAGQNIYSISPSSLEISNIETIYCQ